MVHAGVVVEMLHLLPAIHHPEQRQMAVTLQVGRRAEGERCMRAGGERKGYRGGMRGI